MEEINKEYKYRAFISYSPQDDKFGKWLHKSLEKYKIPKELRKAQPHFLGREILIQVCDAEDIRILSGVVSKDHVHMHIEYAPSKSVFIKTKNKQRMKKY